MSDLPLLNPGPLCLHHSGWTRREERRVWRRESGGFPHSSLADWPSGAFRCGLGRFGVPSRSSVESLPRGSEAGFPGPGGGRSCPTHDGAEAPLQPVISTSWRLGSPQQPPWAAPTRSTRWHHCSNQRLWVGDSGRGRRSPRESQKGRRAKMKGASQVGSPDLGF